MGKDIYQEQIIKAIEAGEKFSLIVRLPSGSIVPVWMHENSIMQTDNDFFVRKEDSGFFVENKARGIRVALGLCFIIKAEGHKHA